MNEHTMMTHIYLRARVLGTVRQLIDDLSGERIEPTRICVHAARNLLGTDLPVTLIIHRTWSRALFEGGAIGALFASPFTAALWLMGDVVLAALVLVLGAGIGGVFGAPRARIANREIAPQLDALRRGELLLVIAVADQAAIGALHDRIKARHPEVAVLGSDPADSLRSAIARGSSSRDLLVAVVDICPTAWQRLSKWKTQGGLRKWRVLAALRSASRPTQSRSEIFGQRWSGDPRAAASNEEDHGKHETDHEEDPSDLGRDTGNPGYAERPGDDANDKKDESPLHHDVSPWIELISEVVGRLSQLSLEDTDSTVQPSSLRPSLSPRSRNLWRRPVRLCRPGLPEPSLAQATTITSCLRPASTPLPW
jgi:hypothetical protein